MLRLKLTLAVLMCVVFSSLSLAADKSESSEVHFQKANELYFAKKYEEAKQAYTELLQSSPDNADVTTNLALSEFHLGNKFASLGWLRRALYLDPSHSQAQQGLNFVTSQIQVREVPRQIPFFENIHHSLLAKFPLPAVFLIGFLCLMAFAWGLISFLAQRRNAFRQQASLPTLPWRVVISGAFFVLFTLMTGLKLYDLSLLRGTVISESVSLQTAPGDNQVTILDVYGGNEVIIQQTQGEWAQVTLPGSVTGWIKTSQLVMTR
ncbi:TPR domain-containing protein [Bdellovibrio bacteriovorus W]|nr:TPR domain-containing protein [Bdellovibrio bacteriovorus W]